MQNGKTQNGCAERFAEAEGCGFGGVAVFQTRHDKAVSEGGCQNAEPQGDGNAAYAQNPCAGKENPYGNKQA